MEPAFVMPALEREPSAQLQEMEAQPNDQMVAEDKPNEVAFECPCGVKIAHSGQNSEAQNEDI
jgi:hypothetical protein